MGQAGVDVTAELLESLPDPVIGCDTDGTIVFWSRAAEEVYGYNAVEALGRRAVSLLHTRFPMPLQEITEELADLGRWHGRLEHLAKNGRTVSVDSRWVARYDQRGAHVGSFAVDRQLAGGAPGPPPPPLEPKPTEDAGSSPRALAHELNNALAIIINYSAFVAAELDGPNGAPADSPRQAMRADVQEVQTAAERALELARQMLG